MIDVIINMDIPLLLPLTVIILSVCLGIKAGKAIYSGLMIGAGFAGIGLIVDIMNRDLGSALKEMSVRFGLSLEVVDVGWQGAAPMAWASEIAVAAVPVVIIVNLIMLWSGWTRTVNIDIWNIWHMAFTGALAYTATGRLWAGLLGVLVHAVIAFKLGDLWAPWIGRYFGLTGLTVPHGSPAYMAPVACLVDTIIEKIPGINRIDCSVDRLEEKAGLLAQPVAVGGIMGIGVGFLAGYKADQAIPLGMEMAAVMVLMPKIVKCIMEGLLPLSDRLKELLTKRFGGGKFYIAVDPSVLLGDSQVVTAGILFIPLTILIAVIQPDNQVLPFGDLATISFFLAIAAAVHKGNLFRILISGSIIMYMTLWIANQTYPWITELGKNSGIVTGDFPVTALDQGGSPISYLYVQLLERQNLAGYLIVLAIYLVSMAVSVFRCRKTT